MFSVSALYLALVPYLPSAFGLGQILDTSAKYQGGYWKHQVILSIYKWQDLSHYTQRYVHKIEQFIFQLMYVIKLVCYYKQNITSHIRINVLVRYASVLPGYVCLCSWVRVPLFLGMGASVSGYGCLCSWVRVPLFLVRVPRVAMFCVSLHVISFMRNWSSCTTQNNRTSSFGYTYVRVFLTLIPLKPGYN